MKKKGFTLVELLVVIAIIALLMGILMPALARVRQIAYRMVCGSNLSGIGKTILLYSNDNDENYPISGGRGGVWSNNGKIADWKQDLVKRAFGNPPSATITSCFYLLIKDYDIDTKQVVCKGDVGSNIFKLSDATGLPSDFELIDAHDFGDGTGGTSEPGEYCSYSYHMPFFEVPLTDPGRPVTAVSPPGSPVCADRNPYLDKNADNYINEPDLPIWDDDEGYLDTDKHGNSASHQQEGQNVLFQDIHVEFEKHPNVGIDKDNIYKRWQQGWTGPTQEQMQVLGTEPLNEGDGWPESERDAYLVNERND